MSNDELRHGIEAATPAAPARRCRGHRGCRALSGLARRRLSHRRGPRRPRWTATAEHDAADPGSDMSLRVVQWSTGNVGRHAIAGIDARPELVLDGVWVSSAQKAGRDAGELAGLGRRSGVAATTDADALIARKPDCIVYTAMADNRLPEAIEDLKRFLAAGINVVSSCPVFLQYPKGTVPPELIEPIEAGGAVRRCVAVRERRGPGLRERLAAARAHLGVRTHRRGAVPGAVGLRDVRQRDGAVRRHGLRRLAGRDADAAAAGRAVACVGLGGPSARGGPGRRAGRGARDRGAPARARDVRDRRRHDPRKAPRRRCASRCSGCTPADRSACSST